MLNRLLSAVFGSRNERLLKRYRERVAQINALEADLGGLSDAALRAKTQELKASLAAGKTLDQLLPEAFAVCREASRRVLGMRHFDVQLIGAMVLHEGKISEMRTGEGKTLMATLAAYLNALAGRGVHVVTVNDYLARRDAAQMGVLFGFLGLSTGVVVPGQDPEEKRSAYAADITYGTNNEFGFDYLRDNMVGAKEQRVQRDLYFGIVDEVDSILIDEARTPLIISGVADDSTELYVAVNDIPRQLQRQATEEAEGDYFVDEKGRQVHLSDAGFEKCEALLAERGLLAEGESLYSSSKVLLLHHLMAALRAHSLYFKDTHYVVQQGKVIIVDDFTGRLMSGRRWGEGLHQAVEAKEGVGIEPESQTLASITFQNYFRMYEKLSGMTGTADTEAFEFQQIYGLETVIIPTHRPMIRIDRQDQIFRTSEEKYEAILADILECHGRQQPVLVGTTSIENSELLSGYLTKKKVAHQVLNAKQHEKEAEIVAQAGRPGVVTIATNMAGRGTDIVLGGSIARELAEVDRAEGLSDAQKAAQKDAVKAQWQPLHEQVVAAGGLHIIGTERHESRRIDNQLRGRSGRQGDPGSSRFYLSMEDSLMRIFAGDRMRAIMDRLGVPRGEAIESGMVTRSIENAQRKVENRNFDIRKQLLDYDNVANDQRRVVYRQRNEILEIASPMEMVLGLIEGAVEAMALVHVPEESIDEQWDLPGLQDALRETFGLELDVVAEAQKELDSEELRAWVVAQAVQAYQAKRALASAEAFDQFERSILLQNLDAAWREHLAALDHLRQGIHLRGYAQKDPKQEYKRESFNLFERLLSRVRDDVAGLLMRVRVQQEEAPPPPPPVGLPRELQYVHADPDASAALADGSEAATGAAPTAEDGSHEPIRRAMPKVGRNDPCPCGSGKKYKQCHGQLT